MSSVAATNSLYDLRRQSELPQPEELKDFVQDVRRKSLPLAEDRDTCQYCSLGPKSRAYKNLLGVSVSFFIIFSTYLSEAGLQSSVNEDSGLGLASLCVLYGSFLLSGWFTAAIIRLLGTKYALLAAYIGMTMYTISNFYPSWYSLIPGSMIIGLAFGPLWASQGVHITVVATRYAPDFGEKPQHLVFFFFGIYTFIYKLSYIPSNIISSVVLLNGRQPNTSFVESPLDEVCNNTEAANLDEFYLYVLLSIYVAFDVLAILLLLTFVDHIGTEAKFLSFSAMLNAYIRQPFIATLKMLLNWKLLMIIVMMILDGYTISFVLGQFTKVYISDCIGFYWIGFCHISFGIGSAVAAFTGGRLVKFIPQYFIVYKSVTLNVGLLVFLLIWERQPSYYLVFIVLFVLGWNEGIWNSVPPSLVGTLLSHKEKEPAYSALRIGMALGFIMGFLFAIVLDTQSMLWIALGLVIATCISYSVLIIKTQTKKQLLPCCYRKSGKMIVNE